MELETLLKELEGFEAIIVDDLGYVQQSREEWKSSLPSLPSVMSDAACW
jgi:hypothetical protein